MMKLKTKFQDEDFDLGEVVDAHFVATNTEGGITLLAKAAKGGLITFYYKSLEELYEEWEDYEEPKSSALDLMILTLTNLIENEPDEDKVDLEDCKQMLEKLKALERLKDKGFRFTGVAGISNNIYVSFETNSKYRGGHVMYDEYSNTDNKLREYNEDLMLLFGGEE